MTDPTTRATAATALRRFWWRRIRRWRTEICQDCGRPVRLVWHADDALFEQVTGQPWRRQADGCWAYLDGDHLVYEGEKPTIGVLCPRCFTRRSGDRQPLLWRPEVL